MDSKSTWYINICAYMYTTITTNPQFFQHVLIHYNKYIKGGKAQYKHVHLPKI